MPALTSSSTWAEITAAYYDNAYYEGDSTGATALNFIQACRFLLLKLPKRSNHVNRNEVEFDTAFLRQEMEKAQSWYSTNVSTTGGVTFADFTNLR